MWQAAQVFSVSPSRVLLPVVVLVAAVAVAGGLLAREVYQRSTDQPVVAATGSTGTTSTPPSDEPGDPTVRLARDAATHPDGQQVQKLLQSYFDALNDHNYDHWRVLVTNRNLQQRPQAVWESAYRTTRDGTITVQRIEAAPGGGLLVMINFTSTQDPALAPPDKPESCLRWHVVYPLVWESGGLKVDSSAAGTSPQDDRC